MRSIENLLQRAQQAHRMLGATRVLEVQVTKRPHGFSRPPKDATNWTLWGEKNVIGMSSFASAHGQRQ